MKSEPETYSIDDLARDKTAPWDGVRNYQARNFMRDKMAVGDMILFYHSSVQPPGVTGLAKVCRPGYPEKEVPWVQVDIKFVKKFPFLITLDKLKNQKKLEGLMVTRRGMRLSIQPVRPDHFNFIVELARKK